MRRDRILIASVLLVTARLAAAAKVSLIVGDENQVRAAGDRAAAGVSVLAFDGAQLSDPVKKARFLARVRASERVISATGGRACGWLAREAAGVPLQCFMPYNGRQVLDFARASGWRRVAAVHIAGYEKVYTHLRSLAMARRIELVDIRVDRIRDLTTALPPALDTAQAVWILGDPLLTEGPAFEYIVETTLAREAPLIAPGAGLIAHGVFLGAENDQSALLRRAVAAANAAAEGSPPAEAVTEVPGGRLSVNRVLARRWHMAVPEGP